MINHHLDESKRSDSKQLMVIPHSSSSSSSAATIVTTTNLNQLHVMAHCHHQTLDSNVNDNRNHSYNHNKNSDSNGTHYHTSHQPSSLLSSSNYSSTTIAHHQATTITNGSKTKGLTNGEQDNLLLDHLHLHNQQEHNDGMVNMKSPLIKYRHLSTTSNGDIMTNGHYHDHNIVEFDEYEVLDEPDRSISMTNNNNKSLLDPIEDGNEVCCLLCNSPFDLSRHKRFVCKVCALNICLNCSLYDDDAWICIVCHQQRIIANEFKCQSWLCKRIVKQKPERELLHFSNAKLRLDLIQQQITNNNNNKNYILVHNENNNHNNSSTKQQHNGHHDDLDDITIHHQQQQQQQKKPSSPISLANNIIENHEDLIAIRNEVELILVKLLGIDTIDYSHIGYVFEDDQYNQLIETYTPMLANLLLTLQQSIYASDCGQELNPTPSEAYNRLKQSLQQISEKTFEFPVQLRLPKQPIYLNAVEKFISDCQSYEHLLAHTIINQIIEDGQSRFITTASSNTSAFNNIKSGASFDHPHHSHTNINRIRSNCSGGSLYASSNYDDHSSAISVLSNSNNNNNKMEADYLNSSLDDHSCCDRINTEDVDDIYDVLYGDDEYKDRELLNSDHYENDDGDDDDDKDDFGLELNFEQIKVYFPEAGLDLIDSKKYSSSMESNISQDSGIKLIDNTQSWQDNWFFKKSKENKSYKQYHLNSDIHFGYMALALSESVPMLIPNPSQAMNPMLGEVELDQVSDLSEHLSETGSIIFSSDEDEDLSSAAADSIDGIKNEKNGGNAFINTITTSIGDCSEVLLSKKLNTVYIENRRIVGKDRTTGVSIKQSLKSIKNKAIIQNHLRWTKIKVPDFVPSELRTICSSIPNPHVEDLDYIPSFVLKPGNASIHSGIVAQFCCKAKGLMPLYFAWYKDGHLIAASADDSTRTLEEMENQRLARTYFGLRFTHRRYVESSCSAYRLIVFNDNECILELKKSIPIYGGVYSVVAYNHSGHDWCDFKLVVDRQHFSTAFNNLNSFNQNNNSQQQQPMSPRPVLRRPQHKYRKTNNKISQLVAKIESPILDQFKLIYQSTKMASPNVIQRTWQERKASELNDNKLLNIIKHQQKTFPTCSTPQFVQIDDDTIDTAGVDGGGHSPKNSFDCKPVNKSSHNHQHQIISTDIIHSKTYGNDGQMLEEYDETVQILQNGINNNDNDNDNDQLSLGNVSSSTSLNNSINIPVMPIAEREHRKWNNPEVNLINNPYSPENIEKRSRQKMIYSPDLPYSPDGLLHDEHLEGQEEEELVPEEKKKFFHSARDLDRYKRDYYLPKTTKSNEKFSFSILNTLGGKPSAKCSLKNQNDIYHNRGEVNGLKATKQQQSTLNDESSFQEVAMNQINLEVVDRNECTSPIKSAYSEISVEVIKNQDDHVHGQSSFEDCSIEQLSSNNLIVVDGDGAITTKSNNLNHHRTTTTNHVHNNKLLQTPPLKEEIVIPPLGQNMVKSLTSLFSLSPSSGPQSSSVFQSPITKSNSLSQISQEQNSTKPCNFNVNNYAVYSLTGRSIPRVFREQNQKNLPRFTEQNRINLANEMLSSNNSNYKEHNTAVTTLYVEQTPIEMNNHQNSESYRNSLRNSSLPSMETNESSTNSSLDNNSSPPNTLPNGKKLQNNSKKEIGIIGAIKKRAVFWEKRIEGNQISDSQVQESFPKMDGSEYIQSSTE